MHDLQAPWGVDHFAQVKWICVVAEIAFTVQRLKAQIQITASVLTLFCQCGAFCRNARIPSWIFLEKIHDGMHSITALLLE